jgi:putative endonuclease
LQRLYQALASLLTSSIKFSGSRYNHCKRKVVDAGLRRHDGRGLVGGWVYILASQPNGVLYAGVTADLVRRVYEHREGLISGFTKRYAVKRLVWFERHEDIAAAIRREKMIKEWRRAYKVRLIVAGNPQWEDLYQAIL